MGETHSNEHSKETIELKTEEELKIIQNDINYNIKLNLEENNSVKNIKMAISFSLNDDYYVYEEYISQFLEKEEAENMETVYLKLIELIKNEKIEIKYDILNKRFLFVNKTKLGWAMMAVSEDKGASTLMGINSNATIGLTFAIGSFLAGIAGVLLCSSYPTLSPTTGAMPGIKAFVAAVLGGIGSIPGACVGGFLLGILENLSKAYISSQLSDAIVFSVLIIVLLIRPTGLLGKKQIEKV